MDVEQLGPVEYLVVAFPGSRFNGAIVPALVELIQRGTVHVIDLAFITKDLDGNVAAFDLAELDDDEAATFAVLLDDDECLLSDDDLLLAAESLEPGDSAAVLVWEDVWAAELARALRDANAEIIELERVPREVVLAAIAADQEGAN